MTRGATRTFAGADGNRLVATVHEAGMPWVMLMHGGGQTRHAFAGTARDLARDGFSTVTVDQRGHGDSDWAPDGNYKSVAIAADVLAVARVLRAESGQSPVVVGASMGGIASLLASSIEPALIAALVLVDVTPSIREDGVARIVGFMREHAETGFATVEEAADAIAAYLPHRPRPKSLDGLRKNLRHRADGRWYWHWDPRFLDHANRFDPDAGDVVERLRDAARALRVPSLLVRGASSELVSPEQAREFLDLAPGSAFVDVADARHMVAGDKNDVFTRAIVDFVERHFRPGVAPARG